MKKRPSFKVDQNRSVCRNGLPVCRVRAPPGTLTHQCCQSFILWKSAFQELRKTSLGQYTYILIQTVFWLEFTGQMSLTLSQLIKEQWIFSEVSGVSSLNIYSLLIPISTSLLFYFLWEMCIISMLIFDINSFWELLHHSWSLDDLNWP